MKELLSTMEPDTDANTVAEFLGGAWKEVPIDQLRISRIKGGMSNMLFLCRLSESHRPLRNEPDKSRPLTCREISLPGISAKIAKRLAKVHQLEVPIWKEPDYICDALQRWLTQLTSTVSSDHVFDLPDYYSEFAPTSLTCVQIAEELDYLREMISQSKSPVKFCHNDLQEGNILLPKASSGNIRLPSLSDERISMGNSLSAFNPADPKLVLIDFEYASYNYRGFDFANHFVEWTIDYEAEDHPYYSINNDQFPSEDSMLEFFISYLREQGSTPENQLYPRAEGLVKETMPFVPVSHLFWGVWGLLQVELSPVGFGFAEYGRDRIGLYYKNRDLLKMFTE
ncbi:hypothetical protein WR25_10408 [Diploscapter pachys]|uniref:Choline/ethanolamine kinase n=1 Tax=Diploscapter pachys TaxID=2018661 RepID=A0A2A2JLZ1_9BILA|nr:hypothetical protein WR25_10408 [Diploscapter pachys]